MSKGRGTAGTVQPDGHVRQLFCIKCGFEPKNASQALFHAGTAGTGHSIAKEHGDATLAMIAEAPILADKYPLEQHAGYESLQGRHHEITIEPRPDYCDRGHWYAKVFPLVGGQPGDFTIDDSDGWPRYYMDHDRAVAELREWLAWREDHQ
jgi:hypothetical protein